MYLTVIGRPGLGLRSHGARSFVPVDIHDCLLGGHLHDPVRGAIPLRRHEAHRCGAVGDRSTNLQFNGEEILIEILISIRMVSHCLLPRQLLQLVCENAIVP